MHQPIQLHATALNPYFTLRRGQRVKWRTQEGSVVIVEIQARTIHEEASGLRRWYFIKNAEGGATVPADDLEELNS